MGSGVRFKFTWALSSCWSCIGGCWPPAQVQPQPGHSPCWSSAHGMTFQLVISPAFLFWICLAIPRPYPCLWTDCLAWRWTCLITVILPYDTGSWLGLSAVSRSVLLTLLGYCGADSWGCGISLGSYSLTKQPCSCCLLTCCISNLNLNP